MSEKRIAVTIVEATIATIDATKMIEATKMTATTEVMTEETTIIIAIAGKTKPLID